MSEFNKEAYIEKKNAERAKTFEILNDHTEKVASSAEVLRQYLDVQSRFDKYSTSNALLIAAQNSQATKLKSFGDWKKVVHKVAQGATEVLIIEPGKPYNKGGKQVTPYNSKQLYDVADTDAPKTPTATTSVDEKFLLKMLMHGNEIKFKPAEELEGDAGALYNHEEKTIYVKKGLDTTACFVAVVQELCFAELAKINRRYDRATDSFEAGCATYMLCKRHGVDTKSFNIPDMPPNVAAEEKARIRSVLSTTRSAMVGINERMENNINRARKAQEVER